MEKGKIFELQNPLPLCPKPRRVCKLKVHEVKGEVFFVKVLKVLSRRLKRVRSGRDTMMDFLFFFVDQSSRVLFKKNPHLYSRRKVSQFREVIREDGYQIRDVRLPLLDKENENLLFGYVFEDTFFSYLYLDDQYDEKTVEYCDTLLYEGLYGLVNDIVDVRVCPGDIVIDAGSWIGDFSAYASAKVGKEGMVYAFEPLEPAFGYLSKTAALNPHIVPVKKGLGDENTSGSIFYDACNTGASSFLENMCVGESSETVVETVRLDDFVRQNALPKVDFIKADIEGYERYMLMGAQETLRRFAPKLALCTYHLPGDPEVMSALIKQANPSYNIVLKSKKLYASVPPGKNEMEKMK